MVKSSFWNHWATKCLRWLIFLPVTSIGIFLLELTGWSILEWTANFRIHMTLLWLIVIVALFGLLGTILTIFWALIVLAIKFGCELIAPRPKPARTIWGTVYILGQINLLTGAWNRGTGLYLGYTIVFMLATVGALIYCAYAEDN